MKKIKLVLVSLFYIMHLDAGASTATKNFDAKSTNTAAASAAAQANFLSTQPKDTTSIARFLMFSPDMPTASINEKNIDQIFGSSVLKIPTDVVASIKKCYCYLEFLIKIEKVKNDASLAQYKTDFKDFLQPNANNSPLKPTPDLVKTKGWQAIQVTGQDIINSAAWQIFCKTIIADIMYNDEQFIINATEANDQLFPFIPNIEQAYTDNDFTKFRLYEESLQLEACMQYEQKNRYLAQCNDWKNLDTAKLLDALAQFKKTDFYNYTHNADALKPIQDPKTNTLQQVIIPSPIREQVLCYSMLLQIQIMVHDLITQKNVQAALPLISSEQLVPNFLFYQATDYIYMNDILTLQNLIHQNKVTPKKTLLPMNVLAHDATHPSSSSTNNVVIQAITTPTNLMQSNPLAIPAGATPDQASASMFAQLPTISIYEAALDKIYGKSGLNIATDQLANLKKTYCYLEFLVKVNKVRTDKNYAQYQQTDFKEYAYAGMTTVNMPTQALVNSNAWKKIPVTQDDIVASPAWQNFIKSMICDCIDNEKDFITKSTDANNQMFPYLPNLETAYATQDYTELRLYLESMQLYALMQGDQKKRYLQQSIDWKSIDPTKMDDAVTAFKKTDFYSNTHNTQNASTTKSPIPFETFEQIVSYFLLITTQTNIFEMLTSKNLSSFLTQANSVPLAPNILTYNSSDFIYLADFLSLQDLLDKNKKNPSSSTIVMTPTTSDNVVIQNFRNRTGDDTSDIEKNDVVIQKFSLKKIGKTIAKGADDNLDPAKNGLNDSIDRTNKASADALDPSKNNFNKIISAPAKKALVAFNKDINKAFVAMDNAIFKFSMDLATAMIEVSSGTVFAACSFAAIFPGSGVHPAAQRDRCKADMNKHKAVIATVLGTIFIVVVTILVAPSLIPFVQGAFIGSMVANQKFQSAAMKDMMVVMMPIMMPIMEGMAIMTDAFTEGFINFSVDMTFCAYSIAHLINPKINVQQEMNRVRAKLEQNRSALNIAMSVFITVVITFVIMLCTMGAGWAYAAMLDDAAVKAELSLQFANIALANAEASGDAATIAQAAEAANAARTAASTARLAALTARGVQATTVASDINMGTSIARNAAIAADATEIAATTEGRAIVATRAVGATDATLSATGTGGTEAGSTAGTQVAMSSTAQNSGVVAEKQVAEKVSQSLFQKLTESSERLAARQAAANLDQAAAREAVLIADAKNAETAATAAEQIAKEAAIKAEQATMLAADGNPETVLFAEEATAQAAEKQSAATALRTTATQASERQSAANLTTRTAQYDSLVAKNSVQYSERSLYVKALEDKWIPWTLVKATFFDTGWLIGQALNIGFSVFGAMAARSADEAAAEKLEAEKKSIESLWRFVEDSKVNATQAENMFLDELHKKHVVAVENQAFELQYYSNFLNGSINNVQNQIAQALAQQYIQMLTPDNNGLRMADIGASWGLETPFTYLYPAQGFLSTTLGRPDFPYAQEIAQAPLASETQSSGSADLSDNQPAATKLWFNQRAVSVVNQPVAQPLNVEIKFRIIYNLTTAYHVGLYLGGNYHDYESTAYLQSLQDTGAIDTDTARLAKMFVLKRDDEKSAPSLGLYENEGKGWIVQKPVDANSLNAASVYHMSAKLDKDQLTIAFWPEDNPSAKWTQTTTVTPCDQRTFGVIFSGVAIEWGVIQPTQPITQSKQARSASNGKSEADREKASKAQWKQLVSPKFGSMTMQSPGKAAILQGQYLYTTQSTGLLDAQGNPITDYVVFANSTSNSVTNIGASPAPSDGSKAPNAIVSLITGNVYNSSNKIITNKQNALDAYAQKNTSIPLTVAQAIIKSGKDYKQQLLNFNFGNYKLTAVSLDAINAGLFIYTCPTTIAAKDPSGNPILDYLIMAEIVNNSLGSTVGMPPSSVVPGMISLITGNVYGKTSATPIDSGYSELTQYTKQYGKLPIAITTAITLASNAYSNSLNSQVQAAQATKQAQVNVVASQTMSFTDMMNALPPSTGGLQIGLSSAAPSKIVATNSSISQLQSNAAGSASLQISGFGPIGLSFGDSTVSDINSSPITYSMPTQDSGQTITMTSTSQSTPVVIDQSINAISTTEAPALQKTQTPATEIAPSQSSQVNTPIISPGANDFSSMGPIGLSFGSSIPSDFNQNPVINVVTTNQSGLSYNQPAPQTQVIKTTSTATSIVPKKPTQVAQTTTSTTKTTSAQTYTTPIQQTTTTTQAQPAASTPTQPATSSNQVASTPQQQAQTAPTFSNSDFGLVGSSGFAF